MAKPGDHDFEHDLDVLGESDTEKLKRLVMVFKTKYQLALKEKGVSQDTLILVKKLREAQEENKALAEQQLQLKEMVVALRKEQEKGGGSDKSVEMTRKLQQALQEKDRQINALKNYEQGFKRLNDRNQQLELALKTQDEAETFSGQAELSQKVARLEAEAVSYERDADQSKRMIESLTEVKEKLNRDTESLKDENGKLKEELTGMKETMVRGLREARDIKQYYQNLINDKTAVLQKNSLIQKTLEEARQENKLREQELEALKNEIAASKTQRQELKRVLDQELREKKEREENISTLADQIQAIKKEMQKYQNLLKEKEDGLLEAKQHLAKKMRESSHLTETLEDKNRQIAKLQDDLSVAKGKTAETLAALETHQGQIQKIQDQIGVWEEKYFRTYERLQDAEAQNRELKKIEEKHQQLQLLLNNLGGMLGQPVGLTQPQIRSPMPQAEASPPRKKTVLPLPKPKAEDSLFDLPEASPSYKNDLFQ